MANPFSGLGNLLGNIGKSRKRKSDDILDLDMDVDMPKIGNIGGGGGLFDDNKITSDEIEHWMGHMQNAQSVSEFRTKFSVGGHTYELFETGDREDAYDMAKHAEWYKGHNPIFLRSGRKIGLYLRQGWRGNSLL